jgi:23S rRNA pseudouridine1911/1915/1917 synthase
VSVAASGDEDDLDVESAASAWPCELIVEPSESGARLDAFVAARLDQLSRMRLRRAINEGQILVDGSHAKSAYRLKPGQRVKVGAIELPADGPKPEDTPLDILFEDEHLAAINKPPGMVVHPAKGHWSGTLASAIAFRFESLSQLGGETRPGIVHRLDRDTSGVIVVAKSDVAHASLNEQFENRTVEKEYFAIVSPEPNRDQDVIDKRIGRHPYHREKMAIREHEATSRNAVTMYHVVERFAGVAAVSVFPKTGRTHQIRVHLASIGSPVLCDRLYSGRSQVSTRTLNPRSLDDHPLLERQALHARRIKFRHPISGETLEVSAPIPHDMQSTLDFLRTRPRN